MTYGMEGIIHSFKCYLLQEEDGSPAPVYSCASGLDYPGVGPEHCYLKDTGRVEYVIDRVETVSELRVEETFQCLRTLVGIGAPAEADCRCGHFPRRRRQYAGSALPCPHRWPGPYGGKA